jgi:hypothetical protein
VQTTPQFECNETAHLRVEVCQLQALRGAAQAGHVHVWPEQAHAAVCPLIRLHALKATHAIVKHLRGGAWWADGQVWVNGWVGGYVCVGGGRVGGWGDWVSGEGEQAGKRAG